MMSVGRLGQLTAELMKGGFPTGTPVAVVQSGSTPLQRTLRSTVATVAVDAIEAGMQAPSVIVIGEVVNCLDGVNFVPYPTLT
jgi:uroporphyrin-III C-methyltransferase/precorrin-2 dehydrogenase/sirohydrochlorin ferrochelatase